MALGIHAGIEEDVGGADGGLLEADAERALHESLGAAQGSVRALLEERRYGAALEELAGLRAAVDRFFDDVMVMVDDEALRANRLKLLASLRGEFLKVADISRLSIARS